ncbi:DUF2332 domain-containing protein [Neobacillus terrae]|uniref:DUF2332 domain-containing protein n=1 Tax=Neobacillus terrae TaxID=3034837 RepID=UPI00140DF33D|nr:DUF2332 domain-containing protein [Neobacillus terrae]NHM30954.1 DUF2332 domain-containing protein [Neobacillus terrae]
MPLKKEEISQKFLNFAENECKGSSHLYEYLSLKIAKDEQILDLCTYSRSGQPVPNLLFGAVHYLLLKGMEHYLKGFYPSIDGARMPEGAFPYFKDFCLKYENEIISLLQTKLVQTNEVRRCAYLYPVFCFIFKKTKKPLAIFEIGTSAGLQLLWDKYSYSYTNYEEVVGNKSSKLHLASELKGENLPFINQTPPPVASRIGFDINAVDLTDENERLWLKSLIWPEHKERLMMFEKAASCFLDNPVSLIEGDGVTLLNKYAEKVSLENTVCIYHTHVANQMSAETKVLLLNKVDSIGKKRDVFHIYNNIQDKYLHLDYYIKGVMHEHTIAETDGHGRWFRWMGTN